MNKDLLLSIDNGTQSLKALVFDLKGQLLAKERIVFKTPYISKHPGWAEQDPEFFWQAVCQACRRLWRYEEINKERIAGVALTSQRGTVINVDHQGKPLRPAILWLDQRKTQGLPAIKGIWGFLFTVLGLNRTIAYFQAEAEVNWIRTNEPDIWQKTHKYLLLSGYLTYKFTGEFNDSIGCQVGYIPFDYKKLDWAPDWDWKWKGLEISSHVLPRLVPPGQPLGRISVKASKETGIPAGLRLIASGADKACEVIGSGALEPSIGCLSFGTSATVNVIHQKHISPFPFFPAYPAAVPDYHTIEVQLYRGFWMINWFKKEFGYRERQFAKKRKLKSSIIFEKLVESVPPGAMGLMLQPYWTPGILFPGPEAKGSVIGFGDIHTKAHLYRSMLEGLAYGLREGKERIEKKTRIPITRLCISGGGSQSRNAMQITADVFGLPAVRPHIYETSGLGAAINIAVGLGFYKDFKDAVKAMTHPGKMFEPNMKHHGLYNALYREVYKKMYQRLKPLYESIQEIIAYPS